MIFATIGSSLPFDRLIRAVDELAPLWPERPFFAQLGAGAYQPSNMRHARILSATEFMERVRSAELIIAHAGMGSLITALEVGKPIVIMPRRLAHGEINTDHQIATAKRWVGKPGVHVAMDEAELGEAMASAMSDLKAGPSSLPGAQPALIEKIRLFIEQP